MGVQPFHSKGPRPLLWVSSRAERGKITVRGITKSLNYFVILRVYI